MRGEQHCPAVPSRTSRHATQPRQRTPQGTQCRGASTGCPDPPTHGTGEAHSLKATEPQGDPLSPLRRGQGRSAARGPLSGGRPPFLPGPHLPTHPFLHRPPWSAAHGPGSLPPCLGHSGTHLPDPQVWRLSPCTVLTPVLTPVPRPALNTVLSSGNSSPPQSKGGSGDPGEQPLLPPGHTPRGGTRGRHAAAAAVQRPRGGRRVQQGSSPPLWPLLAGPPGGVGPRGGAACP